MLDQFLLNIFFDIFKTPETIDIVFHKKNDLEDRGLIVFDHLVIEIYHDFNDNFKIVIYSYNRTLKQLFEKNYGPELKHIFGMLLGHAHFQEIKFEEFKEEWTFENIQKVLDDLDEYI